MQFHPAGDNFRKRHGANLPHWTQAGATYFVTFRLADSIPAGVLERMMEERDEFLAIVRAKRDEEAAREIERDFQIKFHGWLDKGIGECWMNKPEVADLVAGALTFFEGDRYDLWAWCVMPNHVHVVVQPREAISLSEVLHSWRSYTSHEINKMVGRSGQLWQAESFDHAVRSGESLTKFVRYTAENPVKAGLKDWRWVWRAEM